MNNLSVSLRLLALALALATIAFTTTALAIDPPATATEPQKEAAQSTPTEQATSKFDPSFFARNDYTSPGIYETEKLSYDLFVPTVKAGEKVPLLVWLGGWNSVEPDASYLKSQEVLRSHVLSRPKRRDRYRFFLLNPQMPQGFAISAEQRAGIAEEPTRAAPQVVAVLDLIEQLKKDHPIDPERVCLIGISTGGADAWKLATAKPDLFSVMASLSAPAPRITQPPQLKNLTLWVFRNSEDYSAESRAFVNALTQSGATAFYTETGGEPSNDSWTEAFGEYELMNWLTTQTRNLKPATPVAQSSFEWSHLLTKAWPRYVFFGGLVLLGLILKIKADRRKRTLALPANA